MAVLNLADLDPADNWQALGRSQSDRTGFVPLSVFGSIKRGIATGANEFFVLRPSQARVLGLQDCNLTPCIASAAAVPHAVFDQSRWQALADADKPTHLFDGGAQACSAAMQYIAQGESKLYHERYLTKSRRPWYKLEQRNKAALLLAVFGRDGFRVALNLTHALNLTAFHGFYPRQAHERYVQLIWLYFQTKTARMSYNSQHRAYGDGLKKLEPGDWSKLHIPDWRQWSEKDLSEAMQAAETAAKTWSPGAGLPWLSHIARLESLITRYQETGAEKSNALSEAGQLQLV